MKLHKTLKNSCILFIIFLFLLASSICIYADEPEKDNISYTKVTSRFQVLSIGKMCNLEVDYSDDFFKKDPDIYSHDLARASFGMTVSAFRDGTDEGKPKDANIRAFFDEASFGNFESTWFDKKPTGSSIATAIASKKIGNTMVVAFICSGSGYGMEWLSNLTVGAGKEHEGFSQAADLCEERLFKYMDKYKITGNVKLWISGFSRASAVGNLLAGRMMEKKMFSGIYAYFYATPKNTKNPVDYPNIFNIIGQNDPVPMVPLSEWGYGRNGVDLYTPAQESNSSFISSALRADEIVSKLSGLSFRNNPDENRQLRVVLEYLAAIFPTSEDYVNTLQPQIIKVWVQHSGSDILSVLREALKNINAFDPEQRDAVDECLKYLDEVIYRYISGNEIQVTDGSWNTDLKIGYNVILEHMPEVYASWLFSTDDPAELFAASTESLRLVIQGDFDLEVWDEFGQVQDISSQNEEAVYEPGSEYRTENGGLIYLYASNNNGKAVINIPADHEYSLVLYFLKDNTVAVFGSRYSYKKTFDNTNEIRVFNVNKGDTVLLQGFGNGETMKIFNDNGDTIPTIKENLSSDANALILREQLISQSFTLKEVIFILAAVVIVPLFLLFAALIIFLAGKKKKKGKTAVTVCFAGMAVIFAAGTVIFSIMLPNMKVICSILAVLASFMAVINMARYKNLKFVITSAILTVVAFVNSFVFFSKRNILIHVVIFLGIVALETILTIVTVKKALKTE